MHQTYRLTADPLYYLMGSIFALLTTALPAVMGQPRFLPIAQAIVLTVFTAIPLRRGLLRHAAAMLALWLVLQLATFSALSWLAPDQVERAISSGFELRANLLEWLFAGAPLPHSLAVQPRARFLQFAGITLGSLATGGLAGTWFLVRAVNLTGFTIGSLAPAVGGPLGLLVSLPLWSLARIAGYAGLLLPLSEPLLLGQWSLTRLWIRRRNLLIISAALILLSLLLELLVPALWQQLASTIDTGQ